MKKISRKDLYRNRDFSENKKGINALMVVSLFLVLTLIVTISYQYWIDDYVDKLNIRTDQEDKDVPLIQGYVNQEVFFDNTFIEDIVISEVSINNNKCNIMQTATPGLNTLNVGNCGKNVTENVKSIVVFTNKGVYSKKIYSDETMKTNLFQDGNVFGEGSIGDCSQIQNMKDNLNGDYYLTKDVYCYDSKSWNSGLGFIPVGDGTTHFTGTFNGRGYTVYGIFINNTENYNGIFGSIDNSFISNVYIDSSHIEGGRYTGGLFGYGNNSEVSNVHFIGSIVLSDEKNSAGISAYLENSRISKCSSQGIIQTEEKYAGGIIGYLKNSEVINCYSTLDITSSEEYVGGLVGFSENSNISYSYSTGFISSPEESLGGLVAGQVNSNILDSYWDTQTSGQLTSAGGNPKTTVEMKLQGTYIGWNFGNTWTIQGGVSYPTFK